MRAKIERGKAMEKEKCIETLNEIKDYVQEEWDPFEYEDEIKKAVEAVDMAIGIIESSNVCGTMTLNGETYIISKA